MTTIYYLPGHGGRLDRGLGRALVGRGHDIKGRETVGQFKAMSFQAQIDLVAKDLRIHCWHADGRIVANSYGAYLFLHAQAQLPPYIGKVLLLAPIVGEFSNEEAMMGFVPPRSGKLEALARSGNYPAPLDCEIHVGDRDWQSNPQAVVALAGLLGLPVTVVPDTGHGLGSGYVGRVVDEWLGPTLPS